VGFARAANASATIDLIWAANGTTGTGTVLATSSVTLQVILTAGPAGAQGATVSVDYEVDWDHIPNALSVIGYANTPGGQLPTTDGFPSDTGSRIEGINSISLPLLGIGLMAGQSRQLGTVTFHANIGCGDCSFVMRSDANGPNDNVLDLDGNVITASTRFKSAYIPEPSALTALGSGIAMLALLYRRRRNSSGR
jgi:hypothetical protein